MGMGITLFTLDTYLIMLGVNQAGIKYFFFFFESLV